MVHITAVVSRVRVGMSSSTKSMTSPVNRATQVADHGVGHGDRHEPNCHRPVGLSFPLAGDGDIGQFAGECGVPGVLGVDERDAVLEIE